MKFKAEISKFKEGLWSVHVMVPEKVYKALSSDGKKRVLCTLNDNDHFHAGFMSDGKGGNFIMLSKPKLKAFKLELGQKVNVTLEKDNSKYGMAMPEEFEEVLSSDSDGQQYFEKLTDGKKRALIHIVSTVKNADLKISKALTILDHLNANEGKLDFKALNEAFKVANRKY